MGMFGGNINISDVDNSTIEAAGRDIIKTIYHYTNHTINNIKYHISLGIDTNFLIFCATVVALILSVWWIFIKNQQESINPERHLTLPPNNVEVGYVTTRSISVSWDDVYGATSYTVIVHQVYHGDIVLVGSKTASDTSYVVMSLNPGTEYRIGVKSVGVEGIESIVSDEAITATKPEVVSSISISAVTTSDMRITWAHAEGSKTYQVIVRNNDNDTTTSLDSDEISASATGLRPGTWYQINVISVGDLSVTNTDDDVIAITQTVPLPPSPMEVTRITTSSLDLAWSSVHGAESYVITVTSEIDDVERSMSSNATSFVLDDLVPGTEYFISIKTQGQEGQMSEDSDSISETTRPQATTGLEVVDVTYTSAKLRWQPVRGAGIYQVFYRVRGSSVSPDILQTSSTEVTVIGLESGRWYEFVVFSVGIKDRRNEEGSDVLHLQTVPLPPGSLSIDDVTTTSMTLTWERAIGAVSYRLTYTSPDVDDVNVIETPVTTVSVTSLHPGTRYSFRVRSVGDEGQISVQTEAVSDTTVPATPRSLHATDVSTTQISLTWNSTKGAIGYRIVVTLRDNTGFEVTRINITAPSIVVDGLEPGLFYGFEVFSIGVSNRVNEEGGDILTQKTVLDHPTSLRVDDVTPTSVTFSWNDVRGASSYVISVSSDDCDVTISEPSIVTPGTSYTVIGLDTGSEYHFAVQSSSSAHVLSIESPRISVTTLLATPVDMQATSVTTATVTPLWRSQKVHVHYPQPKQQEQQQPTDHPQRFSSTKYHFYYFCSFMLLSTLKSEVKKHVENLDISLNPVELELSDKSKNAHKLDAEGHYNRKEDFEKISKPPKGNLTLNTLFDNQHHRNVIALLGQAGSGKTTLAKMIAKSALQKVILPTCKFVFFIQFKAIDFSKKSYFFEFILESCSCKGSKTVESYKVLFEKLKDSGKVLFIFDGLDEANTTELSKPTIACDVTIPQKADVFIRKLLCSELFPKAIKLVTSRPRQFFELHKSHRPESAVYIFGISKESQNKICQQICGDLSQHVKKYLDDHPYISASCYVPAKCIITIAIIFENMKNKGEITIHSLTDVFVEVLDHYARSDHMKEMTSEIWKLAHLAWSGFVNRKLVFDEDDFKEATIHNDAFEAFLCTSTDKRLKFDILDGDKKSAFSHLIWQELFSAVYLMMIASAQELYSHLSVLKSSQWEVVTRFMYGLCNEQIMKKMKVIFHPKAFCDWDQKKIILKQFLSKSMQDIKEATSYNCAELIQLCSWLQEMNDDDFTRDVDLPDTIVVDGNINPVDVFDLTYILKLSRKAVTAEFAIK